MRILFDASILKPNAAGISTLVQSLGNALSRVEDVTVLTSMPELFPDIEPSQVIRIPEATQSFIPRQLWRERALSRHIRMSGADAVVIPAPEGPWKEHNVPFVMMVHDVGPLVRPELYGWARHMRMRLLLKPIISRASGVVTISHFSMKELSQFLPPTHGFLEVIPCGMESSRRSLTPANTIEKSGRTVLYVGTAHRHKNVETLVDAFAFLPQLRLVLVGPKTERFRNVRPNVDARGWVSVDELLSLLSQATMLVNPSLYEGSSLPALEALASGVPVVLSDIPTFREVAGEAAVYVKDPTSAQDWARGILELSSNPSQKELLALAGLNRVQFYSWDEAARLYVDLLERCLSSGRGSSAT